MSSHDQLHHQTSQLRFPEEYGYKESTLEEEAGQADAQPEFTEMPFGDSDL